jgi:hypothetical protein
MYLPDYIWCLPCCFDSLLTDLQLEMTRITESIRVKGVLKLRGNVGCEGRFSSGIKQAAEYAFAALGPSTDYPKVTGCDGLYVKRHCTSH